MIKEILGDDYFMLHSVSLQANYLVVFAHIRLHPLVTAVESDNIATGFKNMVGNKGAVKISFKLAETSLCFINAHFHSGQD